MSKSIKVQPFHHKETGALSYLVIDTFFLKCIIIDPVLDYTNKGINSYFIDEILNYIDFSKLSLEWALDTHVHADHLTASFYLQEKTKCKIGISENYKILQIKNNNKNSNIERNYSHYFKDEDLINVGNIPIKIISIPGHTITCVAFIIDKFIFSGDLFLMPNIGCGRCDFDGGNPNLMYDSGKKILNFPDNYEICVGHDYPAKGKSYKYSTLVKDQRKNNIFFNCNNKNAFVQKRKNKDAQLSPPKLMNTAIIYNLYKIIE